MAWHTVCVRARAKAVGLMWFPEKLSFSCWHGDKVFPKILRVIESESLCLKKHSKSNGSFLFSLANIVIWTAIEIPVLLHLGKVPSSACDVQITWFLNCFMSGGCVCSMVFDNSLIRTIWRQDHSGPVSSPSQDTDRETYWTFIDTN